jgi:hypothetical protein
MFCSGSAASEKSMYARAMTLVADNFKQDETLRRTVFGYEIRWADDNL